MYTPIIYIISRFKIPCTLVLIWQCTIETKFLITSIKNYDSFKKRHQLQKEKKCHFKLACGEKKKTSSHMHGILCGYLLYSMKNILTMAAPASHGTCVHDTEHLLKETHSPTHTVNFCKYYKGKNLFLTVSRLRANFLEKAFWTDLLLLVTFSMKRENTVGWLNLTCVDNSLTLGN